MAPDRSGQAQHLIRVSVDQARLDILKRVVRAAGPEARRSVRANLKEAGEIVQTEIRNRTPVYDGKRSGGRGRVRITKSRGGVRESRHSPGLLKRATKLKIKSMSVLVYNDARAKSRKDRRGYRYGKRLEFDPKFSGRHAFFYPGYEASKERAVRRFEGVLDDIAREYMKG